jgi:hypothetical protein
MAEDDTSSSGHLFVWTNPPGTRIPITTSPFRVAAGTPAGRSGNSWRVWTTGGDAYVACRDNFREFKVSLHASGIWRVAFTEQALQARPDLALPSGDRVIHRYTSDQADRTRAVVGFQIVVLKAGLYLQPEQRRNWPSSVLFVEAPDAPDEMTVLTVAVVPGTTALTLPATTRGAVIGMLPLGADRTIQLVVTHESDKTMRSLVQDAFQRGPNRFQADLSSDAVLVLWGQKPEGTPWLTALRFRDVADGRF